MPVHKFMEETGETLKKHESCIAQLQKDVDELRKNDGEHIKALNDLGGWRISHEKSFNDLKATIEKENKETRDFLKTTMDRVLDFVGAHESGRRQTEEVRWKTIGPWVTAAISAGGFLTLLLTKIF